VKKNIQAETGPASVSRMTVSRMTVFQMQVHYAV